MNDGKILKINLKKKFHLHKYNSNMVIYIQNIFNIFSSYSKLEGHTRGLATLSSIWYTYKCIGRFKKFIANCLWLCGGRCLSWCGCVAVCSLWRETSRSSRFCEINRPSELAHSISRYSGKLSSANLMWYRSWLRYVEFFFY